MSLDSRLERILAGKPKQLLDAVAASRLLLHSAVLLEQRVNEALAPHALHMKEYLALNLLADSVHEPLRPSSLSVSLDATRTQVTRLLDGLEQRGLVVRSADAQDRRSLQLRLTPEGSALLALAMPLVQAVYVQIWSSIGDAGTHAMQQQLRLVHDRLQNMDASATLTA